MVIKFRVAGFGNPFFIIPIIKLCFSKAIAGNLQVGNLQNLFYLQDIEPYYNWRHLYAAEEDRHSPFYRRQYSEFEFSNTVYNYYIHPQWDDFGSRTLYLKILFVDYPQKFAIIELIGEWNDAIENDIMTLRREITDNMMDQGIIKFIFIAENVLNFHSSDDSYYEDWHEQLVENGGWVAILDMPAQSQYDFTRARLNNYDLMIDFPQWRTLKPEIVFEQIDTLIARKISG